MQRGLSATILPAHGEKKHSLRSFSKQLNMYCLDEQAGAYASASASLCTPSLISSRLQAKLSRK